MTRKSHYHKLFLSCLPTIQAPSMVDTSLPCLLPIPREPSSLTGQDKIRTDNRTAMATLSPACAYQSNQLMPKSIVLVATRALSVHRLRYVPNLVTMTPSKCNPRCWRGPTHTRKHLASLVIISTLTEWTTSIILCLRPTGPITIAKTVDKSSSKSIITDGLEILAALRA